MAFDLRTPLLRRTKPASGFRIFGNGFSQRKKKHRHLSFSTSGRRFSPAWFLPLFLFLQTITQEKGMGVYTVLRRFPYVQKIGVRWAGAAAVQLLPEAYVKAKFQHMIPESGLRLIMFIHTRLLNLYSGKPKDEILSDH